MKELSIFIDESGDFGSYEPHFPFYIITMVFHEQRHPIVEAIEKLDQEQWDEFRSHEIIKVYYDNGQVEVSKILSSVFHALLSNVEFRRVMPEAYKLFQVADLICSMELVRIKLEMNTLSKSEQTFFGNIRDLKKNYLKPLARKEWLS